MEGPVAAAFVAAAVKAAGVRRMGWNWNWEGDVVVGLGSMEGRWTIVRSVRRVMEESKGGILSFCRCCCCWMFSIVGRESQIQVGFGVEVPRDLELREWCFCAAGGADWRNGKSCLHTSPVELHFTVWNHILHRFYRLSIQDLEVISSHFIYLYFFSTSPNL